MAEEQIGDYEIISSLGRGGFGSVYKAKAASGNLVALKVLNPQVLDNQKVVKKFFHEAMILAKLDHPNICRLIEFFPDGHNYAIVMEYVEGTELKEVLQQQPNGLMPFDQALRIAKQSLAAFQYADENGNTQAGYPYNPNGSLHNIAGICDDTGRIFALMPHPERFIRWTQHPRWTRETPRNFGDGLQVFLNAVAWAKGI